MQKDMKNPIQPLQVDNSGTIRFKPNKIVETLLEWSRERGRDLNDLACMPFSSDDRSQFAQLIGYSLGGYGELSYVDDDTYNAASKMSEGLTEEQARIQSLQTELNALRKSLMEPMARLFGVHPEDLSNNVLES